LSKHFVARIQRPPSKEGKKGEKIRRRIITLKITLEGFL
jgi:hypothetical protein